MFSVVGDHHVNGNFRTPHIKNNTASKIGEGLLTLHTFTKETTTTSFSLAFKTMTNSSMLDSFMKDLMPKALDYSSSQVSIVNDNAKNPAAPKNQAAVRRSSSNCKQHIAQDLIHGCTLKEFVETTIRSLTANQHRIDYMKNHHKKESRWQSMGTSSEARLVTPKRSSCPPSLTVDLSFTPSECEELQEDDYPMKMTQRLSPLELDNCLSEILVDTTESPASLSLGSVEEALEIATGFPSE